MMALSGVRNSWLMLAGIRTSRLALSALAFSRDIFGRFRPVRAPAAFPAPAATLRRSTTVAVSRRSGSAIVIPCFAGGLRMSVPMDTAAVAGPPLIHLQPAPVPDRALQLRAAGARRSPSAICVWIRGGEPDHHVGNRCGLPSPPRYQRPCSIRNFELHITRRFSASHNMLPDGLSMASRSRAS